ncbi:MAG: hypothetical protein ACLT33_08975 [Lachnospira pectinoschiza]
MNKGVTRAMLSSFNKDERYLFVINGVMYHLSNNNVIGTGEQKWQK